MDVKLLSNSAFTFADSTRLRTLATGGLPDDARVIYRGRNTVVVSADGLACIKSYKVPGFIKGIIYSYFRAPKAERAFVNGTRLLSLGFSTPEPWGAVICRRKGLLKESYYVCRYLKDWSDLRQIEGRPDFPEIARALAQFMYRLHSKGVWMKDFSMGNVLYRHQKGGYEFCLIDINRMEFDVVDRKHLLSNFGAALDTVPGITTLAAEYAALARPDDPQPLVDEIVLLFKKHQAALWRRRRFKEFIRGKKKR